VRTRKGAKLAPGVAMGTGAGEVVSSAERGGSLEGRHLKSHADSNQPIRMLVILWLKEERFQ